MSFDVYGNKLRIERSRRITERNSEVVKRSRRSDIGSAVLMAVAFFGVMSAISNISKESVEQNPDKIKFLASDSIFARIAYASTDNSYEQNIIRKGDTGLNESVADSVDMKRDVVESSNKSGSPFLAEDSVAAKAYRFAKNIIADNENESNKAIGIAYDIQNIRHIEEVAEQSITDGREATPQPKSVEVRAVALPLMERDIIDKTKETSRDENEDIIWNFFIEQGFSPVQTAAIMGNLYQESRYDTRDVAFNPSNRMGGYGIAQWIGVRANELKKKDNPESIHTQLEFIMQELSYSYPFILNAILATNDLEIATELFQDNYERCHQKHCQFDKRVDYAKQILEDRQ